MWTLIVIILTVVYLLTLPQSIGLGDSGLLAGAAASLGIPHPPGFPSYVMLGHLFTKLPWGSVAWRLGLISVIASVGLIGLLYQYIQKRNGMVAAAATSVFLAFSYSFWSQAVNVETYALTNLVIVSLGILAMQEKPKWWVSGVIGAIGGIGVGLSPIIISIIPSLFLLSLKRSHLLRLEFGRSFIDPSFARPGLAKLIFSACVAGVVAVATYSYLPIRAAAHPFLNWSDPSTIDHLFRHVTGGGLSVVSATAINGFTGSIAWYLDAWVRFGYLLFVNYVGIGLLVAGLGVYTLYKRNKTEFWFWILLVFTNVSLAGLYTSGNRDSWFITSFVGIAVFFGEGIHSLWPARRVFASSRSEPLPFHDGFFAKAVTMLQNGSPPALIRGVLLMVVILPLVIWFPVMRQRVYPAPSYGAGFTTDYITDLYRDLPENAILIGGGETFNALTVYAHEALRLRPDVTPVDFTIYYGQEWYRNNLSMSFPRTRESSVEKTGSPIRSGMTVSADMATFSDEMEFTRMLEQFAAANPDRPAFVTGYLTRQPVYGGTTTPAYVPSKFHLEQHGIVYKLRPMVIPAKAGIQLSEISNAGSPIGVGDDEIKNTPWYLESNYQKAIELIHMEYALALETEGVQLLKNGEQRQAFDRFTRAGEVAPVYFDQNRLGDIIRSIEMATPASVPTER